MERRDFVVIGAGVFGLSVSAELGRRGHDVLCVEEETPGHEWSGSKGTCRIFRLSYDDPLYVEMARRSLGSWRDLEAESGETLLVSCALLSYGEALPELVAGMRAAGGEPELLDAETAAERFPGVSMPGSSVLESDAGVLLAHRVLAALSTSGRLEIRERCRVVSIEDAGHTATVHTALGDVECSAVVVCAGPATASLLAGVAIPCQLRATLEQVAYFEILGWSESAPLLPAMFAREGAGQFAAGAAGGTGGASALGGRAEIGALYGLPVPGTNCYKMGRHHEGEVVEPGDREARPDSRLVERIVESAAQLLPVLDPEPRILERCVYDNTIDEDFVIDRLGTVIVGAGSSGHGFKFAPVVGRLLADLACGSAPEIDLARFSLLREVVAGR